jgi:ATP-dependent exoDNAse (exonuclease V) alpha subunit
LSDTMSPPVDSVTDLKLNSQQEAALNSMISYIRGADRQPYILQGYAGTGKTTLIRRLLEEASVPLSRIGLAAPTNRAAKVLANKTGVHTTTVHGLIYMVAREELDYQRERLHIWSSARNFSELADLVIAMDSDVGTLWQEHVDLLSEDNPNDPRITDEKYFQQWLEARRLTTLEFEGITLPDDHAERLDYFLKTQEERIADHKAQIRALLDQDLQVRLRTPKEIIEKYDLIVVDEASMVTDQIGRDLASFGVKLILVGDPFQLPPVKAQAFWNRKSPDAHLTKIERQKGPGAGIPLAGEALRQGGRIFANESLEITNRGSLSDSDWLAADQIVVGIHRTRERICRVMRDKLGFKTDFPSPGEKIVSVHNDRPKGIMNGELYRVKESVLIKPTVVRMVLEDPYGKEIRDVTAWVEGLEGRAKTDFLPDHHGKFWWGYAITCHQSQGSEWRNVIVCDDWPGSDHDRWLYTAITRASLHCTVVK